MGLALKALTKRISKELQDRQTTQAVSLSHFIQWRTEGRRGVSTSPPEIPKFYKVEADYKLSGKCLVFLFQHVGAVKVF
jgi:hypothetical protein